MQNSYTNVLKRLIAYRKSIRLSQSSMAESMGLSQSYYSKIERGVSYITNELFVKMYTMGMDIDYFITGVKSEKTYLNELWEECPVKRQTEFMGIIASYINMAFMNCKEKMSVDCYNELEVLKYTMDKLYNRQVDTIWKHIRRAHNLTQEKMAGMLELGIKNYRDIEKEKVMPNVETLVRVYEELGYFPTLILQVDTNYLLWINKMWRELPEYEKELIMHILKYNLEYIKENLDK